MATTEKVVNTEQIERARLRRMAKHGGIPDGPKIKCLICGFEGYSLVTHIKNVHHMDATQYDEAAGMKPGGAQLVAPGLKAKFIEAGKKGNIARRAKEQAAQHAA